MQLFIRCWATALPTAPEAPMIPMVTDVALSLDWAARAPVISAMSFVSVAFMIHPLCPPTLRLFRAEHLDGGDAFRAVSIGPACRPKTCVACSSRGFNALRAFALIQLTAASRD